VGDGQQRAPKAFSLPVHEDSAGGVVDVRIYIRYSNNSIEDITSVVFVFKRRMNAVVAYNYNQVWEDVSMSDIKDLLYAKSIWWEAIYG
jgi:hypothetical protein